MDPGWRFRGAHGTSFVCRQRDIHAKRQMDDEFEKPQTGCVKTKFPPAFCKKGSYLHNELFVNGRPTCPSRSSGSGSADFSAP